MADVLHICPRRAQMPAGLPAEPTDRWVTGRGLVGQDQVGLSCSFCGSLNPDRFLQLVRDRWVVEPTDKSYKAYLMRPYTADQAADEKRAWLATSAEAKAIRHLGEHDGKSSEQVTADLENEWAVTERASGVTAAKFYYQHLDDAQRDEFIGLVNDKAMRIGYPGYFYVLPFFATRMEAGS